MSRSTVTRFKFFWAHQDQEQEAWLRAMAQQGLHLESVNPFCFWTFRRGAPRDVVYRLDFGRRRTDDGFAQLMEDAGWILATTCTGWHYWSIPVTDGREPEIFTDSASRVKKFQRLLALLVCSALPAFIMMLTTDKGSLPSRLSLPSLVLISSLYIGVFMALGYSVLRLLLRIRAECAPQRAW
jgi:Protein of unknown function (DUF2812)